MITTLRACSRQHLNLGGSHICVTQTATPTGVPPSPKVTDITDALILPGQTLAMPTLPSPANLALTYVVAGVVKAPDRKPHPKSPDLEAGALHVTTLFHAHAQNRNVPVWANPSKSEVAHVVCWALNVAGKNSLAAPVIPLPAPSRMEILPAGISHHHALLEHGQRWRTPLRERHQVWLHVLFGEAWCCGRLLAAGETALIQAEPCVRVQARRTTQLLVLKFEEAI